MSTLFIVATPIGNLGDMSERAVQTLKDVSWIACEDTRTSSVLFQQFGITTPAFAFHQHNEHRKVEHLIALLESGEDVALISDAGMPGISDPGFLAVRAAWQHGFPVSVIPGPNAAITALMASGLPADRFVFEGFLPAKKGRKTRIGQLAEEERTIILYESPHRILRLLDELLVPFEEDRLVALTRELTKKFEEIIRTSLGDLRRQVNEREGIKGEITLVISGKGYRE